MAQQKFILDKDQILSPDHDVDISSLAETTVRTGDKKKLPVSYIGMYVQYGTTTLDKDQILPPDHDVDISRMTETTVRTGDENKRSSELCIYVSIHSFPSSKRETSRNHVVR